MPTRPSQSCSRSGRARCRLCSGAGPCRPYRGPVGAARRGRPRARDARALDPPPPRREGRRPRALAPRAARDAGRPREPACVDDGLPRARPHRHRSGRARRTRGWHPVDDLPPTAFDHGAFALAGRERLRAKLSYTNLGFALAPETFTISELRDLYAAALGHEVSATNLQRVLLRRGVLEPDRRAAAARPQRAAGRRRCSASARPTSRSPTSSPCCAHPAADRLPRQLRRRTTIERASTSARARAA